MTRQEFLKSVWTRFFKPILILATLVFLVRFFIYALDEESQERQFIDLIGFGLVIGGLLVSVGILLIYMTKLVIVNTPAVVRIFLERNSKRIGVGVNIVLAAIVFYFAVRFVAKGEYGNLVGLVVVIALTFIQYVCRTRD